MTYQLKCKAIALAVEAQAFKKQEQREKRLAAKWKQRAEVGKAKAALATLNGIRQHRVFDIRKEARNALLAYGFVRGLSYAEMENFAWTQPNWDRVEKLAIRYSDKTEQEVKQSFAQWRDAALNGVAPKWQDHVVPGSVKTVHYDAAWVRMQWDTRPVAKPEPKAKTVPEAKVWDQNRNAYAPEKEVSLWQTVKEIIAI